ncbi:MAG: DUF4381 domain-containing protein [Bacteroidota bacterium]|nr:DUF4381 domain-containing protein [Bacteroidota bacterium]
MKKQTVLLFILLLLTGGFLLAQRLDAEAILMKDEIKIGEQVELKLAVRYQEGTNKSIVTWPEFKDTLTRGIEIIKTDSIHTILANRASVLYQQSRSIYITAFDSGMYIIPAQKFIVDNELVETLPQFLYVVSVAVDTTKPIKDIKEIYEVPPAPEIIQPGKPLAWWWWAIIGAAILGTIALIWFLTRKNKNVPVVASFSKQLLPHERVLELLAVLGRKKPWMHGELKEYHIALTEILRAWVVERYLIHAKEMTTGEIIRALHTIRVDASAIMQLERVLRTADLVKFGKANPVNEENENVLQLAMNFVQATAVYPEPIPPQQ